MGRQNEVSLAYFELDCHMDDKIELIEAEYGLKGFAIVIKMYQRIYGGEYGYYCEFTPDIALLLAARLCGSSGGVSGKVGTASGEGSLPGFPKNLITDVVAASIRRGIFSERLFKEYGILTSSGIQKQYLKATAKRQVVNLKKEYLLISVPENRSNVVINEIDSGRKSIDEGINSQSKSRVEKSKSRVEKSKNSPLPPHRGDYYPDELLNQAFLDYLEMRKKIKKPMTDRAVDLAMKKLKELSTLPFSESMDNDTAIKILEQSIMNCWQGLFPLKENKQKAGKSDWEQKWRDA